MGGRVVALESGRSLPTTDAACFDWKLFRRRTRFLVNEQEGWRLGWSWTNVRVRVGESGWSTGMGPCGGLLVVFLSFTLFGTGVGIKCYQCSSTEDRRGTPDGVWSKDPYSQDRFEDSCGVYYPFQKERNIPVECNSDESHTPGTFCVKIVKQGPRGFICKLYVKYFSWAMSL